MNVVWEDLLDGVVHRLQNDVVPTFQKVKENAHEHLSKPPSSTDLVYIIADRLLVSSQPAVARYNPTYLDVGREESRPWYGGEDTGESSVSLQRQGQEDVLSRVEEEQSKAAADVGENSISSTAAAAAAVMPTENPQDGGIPSVSRQDDGVAPNVDPTTRIETNLEFTIGYDAFSKTAATTKTSSLEEDDGSTSEPNNRNIPLYDGAAAFSAREGAENVTGTGTADYIDESDNTLGEGAVLTVDTTAAVALDPPYDHEAAAAAASTEKVRVTGVAVAPAVDTHLHESPSRQERANHDGAGKSPADDTTTMEETSVDHDENDVGPAPHPSTIDNGPFAHSQHPPLNPLFNSPARMVEYLEKRHGKNHFLAFSLNNDRPDDRTLLLFRRQIAQMGWWSPCPERSETPSIPQVLKICYAIHAYLKLDPSHVALVYCANGKTRTAIVVACYLKFAGFATQARQGFLQVLTKRGMPNPERIWENLPPSLQLFFKQFDSTVELGGYLNQKPLLLRAIALQGIPVEDKPCLDIWDSSQRHVYTSHPEIMWQGVGVERPNNISQWADEEGFYRVNVVLEGDFLVLCRFGGDFAEDPHIHDPSKILFRYSNTTGFLSGSYPYELTPDKVDLSRRYAPHLDDDDFLVTLLFESHWERFDRREEGAYVFRSALSERLGAISPIASEQIHRSYERDV